MSGEWKAWSTGSSFADLPSATRRSRRSWTSSRRPETTTDSGPLTAATPTRVYVPSSASTSACEARTASMAPGSVTLCMTRPRAATSLVAVSRSKTPDTWAAAISPTEWPIRWPGRGQCRARSRYRLTWRANSAGCMTSVRSCPSGSSARSSGFRAKGRCASKRSQTSSRLCAKTGKVSYNSLATPAHWAPWPGNMKTEPPSSPAVPRTTAGTSAPSLSDVSALRSSSRSPPSATARCSNRDRLDTSEAPMSARSACGSAATKSRSFSACARSACSDRADSAHGTGPANGRLVVGGVGAVSSSGACSRMRWALVPLAPKLEMPARRGRPGALVHSRASVSSSTAPADQSTCVEGRPRAASWAARRAASP